MCGDGNVDPGEQCDLGMQNSNTGACTLMCKNAMCGDGFVHMGVEQCDDGNATQGDGCNINCVPSGTPVWTQTFNGAANGYDVWYGVTVDTAGNVYVAGTSFVVGQGLNAIVRKYSPAGTILWTQPYNGFANLTDQAYGVAVDAAGNVFAVGYETGADMHMNLWLRKHNSAGVPQWTQTYNIGAMGFDNILFGVTVNAAGDMFVVGSGQNTAATGKDIIVGKFAGINGTQVWLQAVNGVISSNDEGYGIAIDPSGAILVSGYTTTASGIDAWVRKYTDNGNSGAVVWEKTYNDLVNGEDYGYGIAADPMGNVIVAGAESVAGQGLNVWVRKLDGATGNQMWTQGYNNPSNQDDNGISVACDSSGNVIVTGVETTANSATDIWTRKYSSAGAALWTQGYNGSANGLDFGLGVAVDTNGFIFVAGYEATAGNSLDGWLRKYEP